MKPEHLHILQHALGVDQYGRGTQYRNHFVTDPTGRDGVLCEELVAMGYMHNGGSSRELTGGMTFYAVTAAGEKAMRYASPAPPKLSRAKQRYDQYLSEDSDLSFGEWLKQLKTRRPFWSLT